MLGKLAGPYMKVGITVAKNIFRPLATMASSFAINGGFQRKLRWRAAIASRRSGVVRERKGITLVISYKYMDDAFRVQVKKLVEFVKQKNMKLKNKKVDFLVCY